MHIFELMKTRTHKHNKNIFSFGQSFLSPFTQRTLPSTVSVVVSAQSGDHYVRRRVLEVAQLAAFPTWPRIGAERRQSAWAHRVWSREFAMIVRFFGYLAVRPSLLQLHPTSQQPWLPRSVPVEARTAPVELATHLTIPDFVHHH